jgi:hypothetical protein
MSVSNNVIQAISANSMAASAVSAAGTTTWQVPGMFNLNCYQVANLPWTYANWELGQQLSKKSNFATWQAGGQDLNGTLKDSKCPGLPLAGATVGVRLSGNVTVSGGAVVR